MRIEPFAYIDEMAYPSYSFDVQLHKNFAQLSRTTFKLQFKRVIEAFAFICHDNDRTTCIVDCLVGSWNNFWVFLCQDNADAAMEEGKLGLW